MKSSIRTTLVLLASATLAACARDGATAPGGAASSVLPAVRRVVVISVDGLRGDAVGAMPALAALRDRALWTDSMQTVVPSLTVPGHLAMFTGRDVTAFGIRSNALDEAAGYALVMNGASTLFQWTHGAGGRSVALVTSSLVPTADLDAARSFLGIDQLEVLGSSLDEIRARAIAVATAADAPTLLFVHLPTVDYAGHTWGWIRADVAAAGGSDVLDDHYLDAARAADATIDAIRAALEAAIQNGDAALVVTADHGGGHGEHCVADIAATREHCTSQPGDLTIPFFLVAKEAPVGRLAGHPAITQVAASVGALLRLAVPERAGAAVR
jgi:hypothetical protein